MRRRGGEERGKIMRGEEEGDDNEGKRRREEIGRRN